jgi:formate hydrogenlyase transcriptional activator
MGAILFLLRRDPMGTRAFPAFSTGENLSPLPRRYEKTRSTVEVVSINKPKNIPLDEGMPWTGCHGIIGSSPAINFVLAKVERVAPTDATVLVLGETGTGKELIARAIHNLSPRRDRPFVKLNCAAIPFDLLESELFGHERGAFTGAIAQKIGRFEMADTGTLFLDEIGDLPLPLQPKLLRVLQEQEFERLGSGRTHRINVRVVTATHRDLGEMAAQGLFRSDLYYRLNVFPVELPPLRERARDIPQLTCHFVKEFSRRMGKSIRNIPAETMSAFASYAWPGNVRELQNLVERAVIWSSNGEFPNPLSTFDPARTVPRNRVRLDGPAGTFADSMRSLILRTLEETGWVIGGREGAAARLGLPRTTLISKMKKLQLSRPRADKLGNVAPRSADHAYHWHAQSSAEESGSELSVFSASGE